MPYSRRRNEVRFGSGASPAYLAMSALPPIADKAQTCWHVRFVPKAAVSGCNKLHRYSITSSAMADRPGATQCKTQAMLSRLLSSSSLGRLL
jgi:hypothetical protein